MEVRVVGKLIKALALSATLLFAMPALGDAGPAHCLRSRLLWVEEHDPHAPRHWARDAWVRMLRNFSPEGAAEGTIVASTSSFYDFDWPRDGAIAANVVVERLVRASRGEAELSPVEVKALESVLVSYARLARKKQLIREGALGEPKFLRDGSIFTGKWARPQNDGPALRAMTLMKFASYLQSQGRLDTLDFKLYDRSEFNAGIKGDLEYVAHHWRDPSWDLWEEVYGDHFYTRMVQYEALRRGAAFAEKSGDPEAAKFYREQLPELEKAILKHWDPKKRRWLATLNPSRQDKVSNLDAAVVLAFLHTSEGTEGALFAPTDDRLLSTVIQLEDSFREAYPLNRRYKLAVAVGRYPEDHYNGYVTNSRGNPWVIDTHGFGDFYARLANSLEGRKGIEITANNMKFYHDLLKDSPLARKIHEGTELTDPMDLQAVRSALRAKGKAFLDIAWGHRRDDGSSSEQIHHETGFMQGAEELTWNYASLIDALWSFGVKF